MKRHERSRVSPVWVEANPGPRIVDVREPAEFYGELGRIEGAELVPLHALPRHAERWDPAAPIVLVCTSGRRSEAAREILERRGFCSLMILAGGMLAYLRETRLWPSSRGRVAARFDSRAETSSLRRRPPSRASRFDSRTDTIRVSSARAKTLRIDWTSS